MNLADRCKAIYSNKWMAKQSFEGISITALYPLLDVDSKVLFKAYWEENEKALCEIYDSIINYKNKYKFVIE